MKNARDDPLYIIRVQQVQATGASRGGFFDVLLSFSVSPAIPSFDLPQLITMKSPLGRAPLVHRITTCNGGGTKPQTIWEERGGTAAQQEEEEEGEEEWMRDVEEREKSPG